MLEEKALACENLDLKELVSVCMMYEVGKYNFNNL